MFCAKWVGLTAKVAMVFGSQRRCSFGTQRRKRKGKFTEGFLAELLSLEILFYSMTQHNSDSFWGSGDVKGSG
jgi:hypothetical protein